MNGSYSPGDSSKLKPSSTDRSTFVELRVMRLGWISLDLIDCTAAFMVGPVLRRFTPLPVTGVSPGTVSAM